MPLNQFTTQSGWACATLNAVTDVNIVSTGAYITPTLALDETASYNLDVDNGGFEVDGLAGIYLLNLSFTTSGANNDTLAARMTYTSDSETINGHSVEYDSKGAKKWSVNQSIIMQIKNTGSGIFKPSFANLSNANDITINGLIMSAIKIY